LKLKYDERLSNLALNFDLRRYDKGAQIFEALGLSGDVVGKCFCGTVSRVEVESRKHCPPNHPAHF
jgi:glutamate synthase domain-containing protein 2